MSDFAKRTKIEIFPTDDWSETQVDQVCAGHLAAGALSCDKSKTSNDKAWKLITVWATLASA